jgi:hypothetical protein
MQTATTAIREAGDDADFDKLDRAFRRAETTHRTAAAAFKAADGRAALAEAKRNLPVSIHEEGEAEDGSERRSAVITLKRQGQQARVSREPLTYEMYAEDGSISKRSFFRDCFDATKGDPGAIGRLGQHHREMVIEKRALSEVAGEGGSFVIA